METPADVSVLSSRNTGHQAVLKFAADTGATSGSLSFWWLLILRVHHQPLTEASYVNLPTIALCTQILLGAIPCNCKEAHSVGLMWWMLAQEVLCMGDIIPQEHLWEVMPDLYFYIEPKETEKEEPSVEKAMTVEGSQDEWIAPFPEFTAAQLEVTDWSEGRQVPSMPIQQFPTEDWSAQPVTEDWSTAPTAETTEWVGITRVLLSCSSTVS
ncbi:PREDICTED: 40S ribosomal protein SA-like [Chrysochloris asiatica]|uniref:40S ribosomal protein SA-like n=1 Tax=Chrysochloris asiatica TaxID=185453 RepID=A0A9B0U5N1_CHRAS|nr:PREDICTED: 40S ribosomal protein SA-like [Chrysochloris asiatica]